MSEDVLQFSRDVQPKIHPSAQLKSVKLGQYTEIAERVILRDVQIGNFTYLERNGEGIYAEIGHFCSIASNVRINALEHPMQRLTMHKMTYRPNEYFRNIGVDMDYRAHRSSRRVTIGNDVWIGHGAVILPGVSIGTGAVIGANAVVSKDVPPYMIVAGVPAKILRPRFDEKTVECLLQSAWWDWPVEMIYKALPDIQTMEINAFLDKWLPLAGDA
ncbi:DapH/DapD/GlmU-related protein [Pseudochrobactrum lubricantis]|uniref:DapH/DapD/GlmU-related protein n=1 Tax=Pseudochrobactrum lubricantis TaxID=558172 RepID=UPI0035E2B72B